MKTATLFLAFALLVSSATQLLKPASAAAQTGTNGTLTITQVGAPSNCAQPGGITVTNGMTLCATTSGLYYALNGSSTFVPVVPASTSAVASVFGRTGAVVGAAGDYSYSQLSSPPTTISCSTAQINTGASGALSASNCTIK